MQSFPGTCIFEVGTLFRCRVKLKKVEPGGCQALGSCLMQIRKLATVKVVIYLRCGSARVFCEVYMVFISAVNPLKSSVSLPKFSLAEILPWAIFIGLLLMLGIYFVGVEQGATAIFKGAYVHEFVHDSRHMLGFPCH